MSNKNWKNKKIDRSQYKKVEYVLIKLREYFEQGYKLFNLYHFRKKDDLLIQLKDGNGNSLSFKFKCSYPVFRFELGRLAAESNIFKSMYFLEKNKCELFHVPSDTINAIGKLNSGVNDADNNFSPEKYLVYNVLRPEYYVTTELKKHEQLSFEECRVGSLDIEVASSDGEFPEPSRANHPVVLLTMFDFSSLVANVFYLDGHGIDDDVDRINDKIKKHMPDLDIGFTIELTKFEAEKDLLESTIRYMNSNFDVVVGWNLNEYDIAYIINRSKKLETYFDFGVVYDGFSQSYVFEHFVCIDYMSVYKFFVKKNPPSLKLADIAFTHVGVTKIQAETFLDIAYNITDSMLVYLMDQKLSLINQMFSFKENGALLHVFNVRNALEPLFIKMGAGKNSAFIANQLTIYYNIYYNEVYKSINRDVLRLPDEDIHINDMGNIVRFMGNLSSFKDLLAFYLESDDKETKKESSEAKEDAAGTVLSKMVEGVFKKTKRKKKSADGEEKPDDVNISELTCKKNFDYDTEEFDDILVKLYGINIHTIFGYPGAFNKSFRGVGSNIIDLDFFSMYPVIIYSLNISIETVKYLVPMKVNVLRVYDKSLYEEYVSSRSGGRIAVYDLRRDQYFHKDVDELERDCYNDDCIVANSGMIFRKDTGFIPRLCKYFLEVRSKSKDLMNKEEDPIKKSTYNIYQLLYKVYNNSIYGYMGYKYSVLFNRLLVSSVTIMGRSEILFANHRIISFLDKSSPMNETISQNGDDGDN